MLAHGYECTPRSSIKQRNVGAAAPDLLEACETLLEVEISDAIEKARVAVAKAKGK